MTDGSQSLTRGTPGCTWRRYSVHTRARCSSAHQANVMTNPYGAPDTRYRSYREGQTHSFARALADTDARTHARTHARGLSRSLQAIVENDFTIGVPARAFAKRDRALHDVYACIRARNNNTNRRRKIIMGKHGVNARGIRADAVQMHSPFATSDKLVRKLRSPRRFNVLSVFDAGVARLNRKRIYLL